jgi:fatty-acyl-CoA synthase
MFIAELEHPNFRQYDLTSLRTGIMAGAPCPPELMKRVINDMHCREILIGYGETEASPLTHLTSRDDSFDRRINTVGRNLPHQEVKVVSTETGRTLALGEVGEICFRGYHIMRGYYGKPEKSSETIDAAGWLRSGDLGAMDSDGYVKITGRLKEMIIRGGENIYPREIEDFLFTHPKIAEVAVFGVPDEFYGEEECPTSFTAKSSPAGLNCTRARPLQQRKSSTSAKTVSPISKSRNIFDLWKPFP